MSYSTLALVRAPVLARESIRALDAGAAGASAAPHAQAVSMARSAFGQLMVSTAQLDTVLARTAREGDVKGIKSWISHGASDGDTKKINIILLCASATSRPACARVVEAVLPHARDQPVLADCLRLAAHHGAEETVKCLLRGGTDPRCPDTDGYTPILVALFANGWDGYRDEWSRANARRNATSLGNQNIIRMLLRHGAAVDARTTEGRQRTPLLAAARYSGFISLGAVRELLRGGASLDAVDTKGRTAEAIARTTLQKPIYGRPWPQIPDRPDQYRRLGAVEAFLALLGEVRAAGGWKRYANAPRVQLVVLRKLAESGRAVATRGVATRLFAPRRRLQAMGSRALPDVLFWKILEFWRTDRDP